MRKPVMTCDQCGGSYPGRSMSRIFPGQGWVCVNCLWGERGN